MKGLTDLSSLAAAPALRRLFISGMPQLTADSFRCFVGHPHLEELWAYTGRSGVRAQIKQMFPGSTLGQAGCPPNSGLPEQPKRAALQCLKRPGRFALDRTGRKA